MRLTFLVSSLWLSGGVNAVAEYARRLKAHGHQVAIVVPRSTVDAGVAQRLGVAEIIEAGPPEVRVQSKLVSKLMLSLALASAVPPSDVIIATHTPTVLPTLWATRKHAGTRAVWFYQDYMEMFDGRTIEQVLLRTLPGCFHDILVVSCSAASEIRQYGAKRVTIVRQGLADEELFVPPADSSQRQPGLLLCLGDMRPRKGLFDFLAAVERIYHDEPNIHLAIVSKSEIKVDSRIPMDIHYRPPRRQLAELYRRCQVFVSASWWESFGLPPLEAMACGAPVVLTDSRGVRDYARPEENCLMVPPRDSQALAAAIRRVLREPALANRLGKAGPPTARDYRWDECVNRFESALLRL